MEETDVDLNEASGPGNQEQESGSCLQGDDAEVEILEKIEEEENEESEKMVLPQRILNLQRDLLTYMSNILTEDDAKESLRRKQQEEADRLRLEMLKNNIKLSQERFEEIIQGWSTAGQKVTIWELQEVLKSQKQLCSALKEDKLRCISELQQELKAGDNHFVRDLKKNADVLGLMMRRIEEQTKTLQNTFREELAIAERVSQQENDDLLLKDKTEWEHYLKELLDEELAWLTQRQKEMEEHISRTSDLHLSKTKEKSMIFESEFQKFSNTDLLEAMKENTQVTVTVSDSVPKEKQLMSSLNLERKFRNLLTQSCSQKKQFTKRNLQLSDQHKHKIEQNKRTREKIQHFAAADGKQFKQVWLMIDEEVKQLVEMVLVLDSLIWKHLGLAWERPHAMFMEQTGPIQTQKQAQSPTHQAMSESFLTGQVLQSGGMMDASVGPALETETKRIDQEEAAMQSEGGAEEEEEESLSDETLKKVTELLCDELGFLLDEDIRNLLAPTETKEETVVKMSSLLSAFGIEEDDFPGLAHFLLKYKNQQRVQTEDVRVDTGGEKEVETGASGHVTPNHVVPALKSFLEQHVRSRENSEREDLSFQQEALWDTSDDKAYWESMGNIISEDREGVWEIAEKKIEQYHEKLREVSHLITETQSLEQQNVTLRMLLLQDLRSTDSVGHNIH